jgi:hypothetical protein
MPESIFRLASLCFPCSVFSLGGGGGLCGSYLEVTVDLGASGPLDFLIPIIRLVNKNSNSVYWEIKHLNFCQYVDSYLFIYLLIYVLVIYIMIYYFYLIVIYFIFIYFVTYLFNNIFAYFPFHLFIYVLI